jgi:spore maturation protein A
MLNKIWFSLLCIGIVYGFAKASYQTARGIDPAPAAAEKQADPDNVNAVEVEKVKNPFTVMGERLTNATIDAAESSVTLCIGLVGFMALWLGLLNIARDAGLVDAFARMMSPLMRWLFPGIPNGHPAQGAILMNLSANMLGLDNAATPMGLKAMTELQTLNPVKDTATNSMAMFLAINNSSVTIIPITIIGLRAITGSQNPAEPLGGTLIVTTVSTVSAVFIARWLSHRPAYRVAPEGLQTNEIIVSSNTGEASNG